MSTIVRVQYGVGETEPTVWLLAGTLSQSGTVCTPPMPNGTTVWLRSRTEELGFRPSAWTISGPIVVGETTASIYSASITIAPSGTPTVIWDVSPVTLGVRIEYSVQEQGTAVAYTDTVDADAQLGQLVLSGETVGNGQVVNVRVTPYPGFSLGSVTGTAGGSVTTSKNNNSDPVGSAWDSSFDTSWG